MKSEKELLEQRATIYNQVKDKWKEVNAREGRSATEDELAFFNKADKEFNELTSKIEELRKQQSLADKMKAYDDLIGEDGKISHEGRGGSLFKGDRNDGQVDPMAHKRALGRWMQHGEAALNDEERSLLGARASGQLIGEMRGTDTQISSTQSLGGYAMPEFWAEELVKEMKYFGGMIEAAGIRFKSRTGGPLHLTSVNDTATKGAIIGQGAADTVSDLTFAPIVIGSYSYTSKPIKWSWEAFDDLGFNIDSETRSISAERLGRVLNEHFTLGNGTTAPQGVATGAGAGKTFNGATAVTRDELLDLVHSVDAAYRKGPRVGFMFHDSTLAALKKLTYGSGDDRPLWQPSIREGEPDRIEGFRYWINNDMEQVAAGKKSFLFGDFSKYAIRQVGDFYLARSSDRYIDERAVVFFMFCRFDAKLLSANAIKYGIQSS